MLAKLVLFGYFALGGASKAYFNEYFKHHAMAREMQAKRILSMANFKPKPIEADERDPCKKCHDDMHDALKEGLEKDGDESCEKPDSKEEAEFCDFRDKAPRIVDGLNLFLLGNVAAALSESICTAYKFCQPEDPEDSFFVHYVNVTTTLNSMMLDINLSESFDLKKAYIEEKKQNIGPINDYMVEFEMSIFEHEEEDFEMEQNGHPRPDQKCMEDVVKHIMVVLLKKVVHLCMTSTLPEIKKICDWTGKHKPEAFGFMLAATEPWKVAYGYCFAHEEARLISKEKSEDSIYA